MPPSPREKQQLPSLPTGPLEETDDIVTDKIPDNTYVPDDRPLQVVWKNVIVFVVIHLIAAYGLFLAIFEAKWQTTFYGTF